ncbi:MAG: formate dehydrogenase accessory sulfurtransferase FdhD [Actinomycetota bacterium]
MSGGRTRTVLVESVGADGRRRGPDELVVEEPLEIRLDGHLVATTMRTPGHDVELAVGWCHGDGLLDGARVLAARHCGDGSTGTYNVIDVDTGGRAPEPAPRLGNVSSSCGLCGSVALGELVDRLGPVGEVPDHDADLLARLVDEVTSQQTLFGATGSVHGAAAFDAAGSIDVVREDIGRHNAVDKVVGRRLLDDALPDSDEGLIVTGRASFEMVQKAWAAGFGTLVAVSGPSALAVEAARRAGLTLVGFARGDRLNVYAGTVG